MKDPDQQGRGPTDLEAREAVKAIDRWLTLERRFRGKLDPEEEDFAREAFGKLLVWFVLRGIPIIQTEIEMKAAATALMVWIAGQDDSTLMTRFIREAHGKTAEGVERRRMGVVVAQGYALEALNEHVELLIRRTKHLPQNADRIPESSQIQEAAPDFCFGEGIGELFLASSDLEALRRMFDLTECPPHAQREPLRAWCQVVLCERRNERASPEVAQEARKVDWTGGEARAYLQTLLDLELGPELDEAVGRLHMLAIYLYEQATRFVGDPPSVEDDPDVA